MNPLIKLKWLRQGKGISLRQMEKDLGISNTYLSQLENGKNKNPSVWIIQKIARYYGISIEEILAPIRQ